jgi:RNA polymerase subunit RPABC4/transcription elongation factor Spt4
MLPQRKAAALLLPGRFPARWKLGMNSQTKKITQRPESFAGDRSIDEIDNGAVSPVQESNKLAEVWRGHIVVYGVEIAVIGDVKRIKAEPDVMRLAALCAHKRDLEVAVDFHIQ